ncbi:MAG: hypothetical protein KAV87_30660 [Desulfobacteraceae bacterium]|nr:hypothetical protein [Desulfobacteraceae bacterium]
MSRNSEEKVATLLEDTLGVKFEYSAFKLVKWGNVDEVWGKVDRVAKVCSNKHVFLEVENGQAHPDTNVLKVWPYLRENRRVRIFLIQAFSPKCLEKSRARVHLSEWTAHEIEKRFTRRFNYCKITFSGDTNKIDKSKSLKKKLKKFLSDGC